MATEFKDWVNASAAPKDALVGSEKIVMTDGDSTKTITPEKVKNYVFGQAGSVGQALIAAQDAQDATSALGLEVGVNVQEYNANLTSFVAACVVADTAGPLVTDDDGITYPTRLAGPLERDEAGEIKVVAKSSGFATEAYVNSAITEAVTPILNNEINFEQLDNYYARVDEQSAIVRDFVGNKSFEPFQSANFGTGTGAVVEADGEAWHSGNVKLFGGTASGAGIRCGTYNKAHILFGGERAYCYLKSYTLDATTMIFGIHDGTNATLPANGHYFYRSNSGVVSIRSANASTETVHAGTYTIFADTWYRYFIVVSTPRSHVTYVILDDTGNTVLFSKTVAAPFNNSPVGMNLITHSTGTDATVVRHILDKLYFNPRNWN